MVYLPSVWETFEDRYFQICHSVILPFFFIWRWCFKVWSMLFFVVRHICYVCVSHQRAIKIASNSHNSSLSTNKTVQNCYLKTSSILLKVKRKLSMGWVLHISSHQVAIKPVIYNPSPSPILGNILKNVAAHSNFPRFFS